MKRALLIFAVILLPLFSYAGDNKKSSDWKELQSIILPQNTQVYEGVNSKGNPKYWIMLTEIQVSISKTNVEHLISGDSNVELVKWFNPETGKYKYTTRKQKTPKKEIPNIDLTLLR